MKETTAKVLEYFIFWTAIVAFVFIGSKCHQVDLEERAYEKFADCVMIKSKEECRK